MFLWAMELTKKEISVIIPLLAASLCDADIRNPLECTNVGGGASGFGSSRAAAWDPLTSATWGPHGALLIGVVTRYLEIYKCFFLFAVFILF